MSKYSNLVGEEVTVYLKTASVIEGCTEHQVEDQQAWSAIGKLISIDNEVVILSDYVEEDKTYVDHYIPYSNVANVVHVHSKKGKLNLVN